MDRTKEKAKVMQNDLSLGNISKLRHDCQDVLDHLDSNSPAISSAKKVMSLVDEFNNGKITKSKAEPALQNEIGSIFMFA